MDISALAMTAALPAVAAPAAVVPVPDAANQLAATRFAEMMAAPAPVSPPAEPVAQAPLAVLPQAVTPVALPPPALAAPDNRTMGDSILSGMQGLSAEFQQSWTTVNAALQSGSEMSTTDMLRMQMGLVQMTIQHEFIGKTVSRATQNLDQLVKLQ